MTSLIDPKIKWSDRHVQSENVTIGNVIYQPGGICGPRKQPSYQIIILHSGSVDLRVNSQKVDVVVGKPTLLLPGMLENFKFSTDCETRHSWCSINPDILSEELKKCLNAAPRSVLRSEFLESILYAAFSLNPSQRSLSSKVIDSIGTTLFWCYLDLAEIEANDQLQGSRVRYAIDYIYKNYPEKDCLEKARQASGMSYTKLLINFKSATGTTPSSHLWKVRTEKGVAMLSNTGLSIAEIAFSCGFSSPYHFSNKVLELQGVRPKEIRKQSKGNLSR